MTARLGAMLSTATAVVTIPIRVFASEEGQPVRRDYSATIELGVAGGGARKPVERWYKAATLGRDVLFATLVAGCGIEIGSVFDAPVEIGGPPRVLIRGPNGEPLDAALAEFEGD